MSLLVIKTHFAPFYDEFKFYIWLSIIGLSLPNIVRGFYDIINDAELIIAMILVFFIKIVS